MNFARFHTGLLDSVRESLHLMKNILVFAVLVTAAVCVALATSTHSKVDEHGELQASAVFESVCSVTLYPDVCVSTLLAHPESRSARSSKELATIVVKVTLYELKNLSAALSSEMSRQPPTGQSDQSAVDDCLELFGYSFRQLYDSLGSLQNAEWTRQEADDVQTWLSASLTNQDTCIEGVNGHNYGNPMLPNAELKKIWKSKPHQLVHGEARFARKIVTVTVDVKKILHGKPHYTKVKGGDTSTPESGSEDIDDVVYPKVHRGAGLARLTPIHEEEKPYDKDGDVIKETYFEVTSTLRDVLKTSSLWRDHVQTYTQSQGINSRMKNINKTFNAFAEKLIDEHLNVNNHMAGPWNGKKEAQPHVKDFVDVLLQMAETDTKNTVMLCQFSFCQCSAYFSNI